MLLLGNLVLSVSGKGGTGKTTLVALLLKILTEENDGPMLAVDADPATNLPNVLGVQIQRTVGDVEKELRDKIQKGAISPDISKKDLLEAWVYNTLVETEKFDLLAMGRSEGEGCYCSINYLLTQIIDAISNNYNITLMDMEAGLEHLSRRTDRDVDTMLVTTDGSNMAFETALRIRELTKEVRIELKRICLVGMQITPEKEAILRKKAADNSYELISVIPFDSSVSTFNTTGRPLLDLPRDSPSVVRAREIISNLELMKT